MTPEFVLTVVKSVADSVTEVMKYLQTPEGQKDRAEARANEKAIGQFFADFFSGKLFK